MMPFNLTFRCKLRKYIPQLTDEDINRYESLTALRTQLIYENIDADTLNQISNEAQSIIAPVEPQYNRVCRLWNALREYALAQGNFLQVPPTLKSWGQYFKKLFNYRWTQLTTLPPLWLHKGIYSVKHLSVPKTISIAVPTGLVVWGLLVADLNIVGKPNVSDIPDQVRKMGVSFDSIALDNYVSDPNHSDSEMTWSYKGNKQLTVEIDADRVANIGMPNPEWIGSDTIIFTATDPSNLSDSDDVVFKVESLADSIIIER